MFDDLMQKKNNGIKMIREEYESIPYITNMKNVDDIRRSELFDDKYYNQHAKNGMVIKTKGLNNCEFSDVPNISFEFEFVMVEIID